MNMNGRAAGRVVRRRSLRAILIASLLLIHGAPILAAGQADPVLLPASARYARNHECAAVNIHMPKSMHQGVDGDMISPRPVDMPLSQGDYAICFAYATADMISQRVGTEISALDVAAKYYFSDPSRLAQSTHPALLRHLRAAPDYLAKIAASRALMEVSGDENAARLPYVDKLEGGEEDIAALLYNLGGLCEDKDLPSYDGYTHFASYLDFLRKWTRLSPGDQYSRRSLASATPAIRSPETDAFNAAWVDLVEKQCHRRPLPAPLLPVSYRVAANEAEFMQLLEEGRRPNSAQLGRIFSMIDYALDHGRAPAIGYSWYALGLAGPDEIDLVADHSSVIIGRRRVGAACQYRVQDNTGEYCSRMRPGIRERCDYGRIWLAEDELKRTLYSVTYLR